MTTTLLLLYGDKGTTNIIATFLVGILIVILIIGYIKSKE
jgi:hypothetical protein